MRVCKYPLWGNDERPTHEYCNRPAVPGESWCFHHYEQCHTTPTHPSLIEKRKAVQAWGAKHGYSSIIPAFRDAPNKWSPSDLMDLIVRWQAGESLFALSERFGRSQGAVAEKARRIGLPRRRVVSPSMAPPDFSWTPDISARLSDLWRAGKTTREIAIDLGVTRNMVISKARRLDLPARENPIKRAA